MFLSFSKILLVPEDPDIQRFFDLMGKFFTVKLPSRRNLLHDEYPEHEEHEEQEEQEEQEQQEQHEEMEEEPMEDDATIEPDTLASESLDDVAKSSFEVLSDVPDRHNDPHDERLAWRMGGDEMMKPTPSPRSPWTRSKSWMGDKSASPESKSIEEQLAAIEYLAFNPRM